MRYDFIVIGGGIVGLSAAMHVLQRFPGRSLLLLEKESALARHQTGRNSGVIHAGVYYRPGSLQAGFCRDGAAATMQFCAEHGLRYERCGKLIVATDEAELARMNALAARCADNQIAIERLDAPELRRREPHITGMGALFVPATGMTDYAAIAQTMAAVAQARGAEMQLGHQVTDIQENANQVCVSTDRGRFTARTVIACAGLFADRLADFCGLAHDFRIVPFRGEYYQLQPAMNQLVTHHIYPVPDPSLPFLGVHLTRTVEGTVTVGPNAVLSLAREGYTRLRCNRHDIAEMLAFSGFWKLLATHARPGAAELWSSLSKARYVSLCKKCCPELRGADLIPYRSGVRAQVVMRDGRLFHDFLIRTTARTLHVCNAPSPAATSAIPIGRHIAQQVTLLESTPA